MIQFAAGILLVVAALLLFMAIALLNLAVIGWLRNKLFNYILYKKTGYTDKESWLENQAMTKYNKSLNELRISNSGDYDLYWEIKDSFYDKIESNFFYSNASTLTHFIEDGAMIIVALIPFALAGLLGNAIIDNLLDHGTIFVQ